MNIVIDPKYVSYIITVDETGKTTVKVSIEKAGLPENAKKINISYMYLKKETADPIPGESESEEPVIDPEPSTGDEDAPQPTAGTIATVGERIDVDENTEYPIVGEFEIDGIPENVNAQYSISTTNNHYLANEFYFGDLHAYTWILAKQNAEDQEDPHHDSDYQLELIENTGGRPDNYGIALGGTKIDTF